MAIPSSGSISTDDILAELRISNSGRGYPLSFDDADVLSLSGKTNTPVVFPDDFYGKSGTPPLTATGVNASNFADSTNSAGTVSCNPSVNVSGGRGTRTYQWSANTITQGATLSNVNSQSCTFSYAYARNSSGSASAVLRCTVSDSSGSVVVNNVFADLSWEGNL